MSIKTRTAAVIASALAATTIAGVAAFASPATGQMGDPTHMAGMDEATMADMAQLMADDATIGQMHQWMADNGMPVGDMHQQMTRTGTNPGQMHRSMARPTN